MEEDITIGEITRMVESSSTSIELSDNELKKRYLLWNIAAFNTIASKVDVGIATFGTGYPFYALDRNLNGEIPVIPEQIRYNRQLVRDTRKYQRSIYECVGCLGRNYSNMRDLKTICKPCPNTPDSAKPRKLINRLPDIDMWLVCEDGKVEEAKEQLKALLEKYNMLSSDVAPMISIQKVKEIAEALKNGRFPEKGMYLPIDAHIVEYSYIEKLIRGVPAEMDFSARTGKVPYLPIHPVSLRKEWQQDDTAYNFIYDFLAAFTTFGFPEELGCRIDGIRFALSHRYAPEELYQLLMQSATDANRRRFQTPKIKEIFLRKMQDWGEMPINLLSTSEESKKPVDVPVSNGPSTDDDL